MEKLWPFSSLSLSLSEGDLRMVKAKGDERERGASFKVEIVPS